MPGGRRVATVHGRVPARGPGGSRRCGGHSARTRHEQGREPRIEVVLAGEPAAARQSALAELRRLARVLLRAGGDLEEPLPKREESKYL